MKNTQLKGFSFVEILMIITILALISVVAYTSFGVRQNNAVNSKIQSEVTSLGNALLLAKQENKILPQPQGNKNFFAEDTSYVHDFEDSETFGVHGFITHNTLAKKYIDIVPVDPRTGSFYAYGKSKGTGSLDEMYEIAGVVWDGDTPSTFVSGDYTAENGPFNLIREYNGPNFVHNESTLHFPYNPLERILTAKIDSYTGSVSINGIETYTENQLLSYELKSGDTIEVKQNGVIELYYSDGSRSVLGDTSNDTILTLQKMDFIQDNNIITDIKLVLESGMIWNKAASLDDESGFEIYTTDSTAAVRGTIFGVQKNASDSEVIVQKGTVAIKKNMISNAETLKSYINNEDTNSIPTITIPMIPGLIDYENQETIIKVENNDSEKGASVGGASETLFSTGSIDDIPTIIKDETIDNNPTINPNIKISLKEYSYSSSTNDISIILDIPKRVYKTADFLIINDNDILLKQNWGTSYTQSGRIISHTFDNSISPIDSADFTESDIVSQSVNRSNISVTGNNNTSVNAGVINPNEYGNEYPEETYLNQLLYTSNIFPSVNATLVGSQDLASYVSSKLDNGENDFTLQIGKRSLNGKIRVTNKVKFTIVEDKVYNNEEKEDNVIDEDEIKREGNEKLGQERGIEEIIKGCNGFYFDNIDNEKDLCASADTDLKINGWNIVAFAPYDNAGDLNLYMSGGLTYNNFHSPGNNNITGVPCLGLGAGSVQCKNTFLTFGATLYDNINSFVTFSNGIKGLFIDNTDSADKLKYHNVNINGNFIIEFNIKGDILHENGNKYLLDNPNNKGLAFATSSNNVTALFINGSIEVINPSLIINPNHFYKIELEKISGGGNNTFVKIYNTTTENLIYNDYAEHTNLDFSTMYVGSKNDYNLNINGIIESIKIYSK